MLVASAEAPILAMLLPSSSAPIRRSRMSSSCETTSGSRLPCLESRNMLASEAPVRAVSLAAKKPDTSRQTMTMENPSQSMQHSGLLVLTRFLDANRYPLRLKTLWFFRASDLLRELLFQEIAHRRGLDVPGDDGAPHRLQQDEGELAARDLLVLRHQRHQRIGVGKPFLREARDILQARRQAGLDKVTLD